MKRIHDLLLALDSVINFILGMILLLYPSGMVHFLGLPKTTTYFYSSILGGVLMGISIALGLERWGKPQSIRGLSIEGAVMINFAGSLVLLGWLIWGDNHISLGSQILLWFVALMVLSLAVAESISLWISK